MNASRLVIWSPEALGFWRSAGDNSISLDVIISHASISQTGYAFEDLINTINSVDIRRKIKTIAILDTAYLYRHCTEDHKALSAVWFMNNQVHIDKLNVDFSICQWTDKMEDSTFQQWLKQIMEDYEKIPIFRDLVRGDAAVAASKGNGTFEQCLDFILEECAYICANLRNAVIAYPMQFYACIKDAMARYDLNIQHLSYKPSSYSRKRSNACKNIRINQNIIMFLMEAVNANFFVIDRNGNYIYKNNRLSQIIGEVSANIVAPKAWLASVEVMQSGKNAVVEEEYEGQYFLSVKSPLVINDIVEGVMGVSIDITDRKKTEQLLVQNAIQCIQIDKRREFATFTAQLLHDIASPVSTLDFVVKSADVSEKVRSTLKEIVGRIRNIVGSLMAKYKEYERRDSISENMSILVPIALGNLLVHKEYLHNDKGVSFCYSYDPQEKFTFLQGNLVDFERMISNLLNNAAEALKGKGGTVGASFRVNGKHVDIVIKDNGCGMPPDVIEKIKSGCGNVDSSKHNGRGLGLQQVFSAIKAFGGKLTVESQLGMGTIFRLKFPLGPHPGWISERFNFRKGDVIVVLDDDESVFAVYQDILQEYSDDLTLEFFTNSREALGFISAHPNKEKVYFLCDYELKNDDFKGLAVILQSGVKTRSVLVTETICDKTLHDLALQAGVVLMPKQFLRDVPICVS
ncbi:MAG: PAS domain-containing sensor histidine kinase [Holosporaceae bacterium]|jgi:signal transduction histidine kinase|nr:PAS domain-containing sensor histidine kinase [Holosporaceae bacterium]